MALAFALLIRWYFILSYNKIIYIILFYINNLFYYNSMKLMFVLNIKGCSRRLQRSSCWEGLSELWSCSLWTIWCCFWSNYFNSLFFIFYFPFILMNILFLCWKMRLILNAWAHLIGLHLELILIIIII